MPGTLEAEDYDNGGEGVAYHDTVAGNQGGAYRNDDVDIEAITGGYTLAYIRDTEWTQYTVTVQQAGDYQVGLRAAAWNGPRTVRILAGTTEIGAVTIPQTASPADFTTATTTVHLAAGTQAFRLAYTGDGMNLDRIETALVTPTVTPTSTVTPTPTPTTVPEAPYPAAHVLPAQIQAEHFDAGGEGVSYHDYEPANLGGDTMRAGEGVDVETDGGITDVCFVRAGEYLKYSVDTSSCRQLRHDPPRREPRRVREGRQGLPRRRPGRRGADRPDGRLDGLPGVRCVGPAHGPRRPTRRDPRVRGGRPAQPRLAQPRDGHTDTHAHGE